MDVPHSALPSMGAGNLGSVSPKILCLRIAPPLIVTEGSRKSGRLDELARMGIFLEAIFSSSCLAVTSASIPELITRIMWTPGL